MAVRTGEWVKAAELGELASGEARAVDLPNGRTAALFFDQGTYYAVDNQCPHMGFPLTRGLVRNGTVTCDWHGRCFDLTSGGCFHAQCDDVRVFATEIRDGSVWLFAEHESPDRKEARLRLLWEGLLGDDLWTMSKAIALLLHEGVPESEIVELIMRHVGRHIASSHDLDGGDDVSRLINGLKVGQRYGREDRLIALATAARSAAGPAAEVNENVPMPPPYDWDRIARWVRNFSRDRMDNRIERCLYTAWVEGDAAQIFPLLFDCAVEPYFLDYGSNLVSISYLAELEELFGWDEAGELIFNLSAKLLGRPRAEPERFRRDAVSWMDGHVEDIESVAASNHQSTLDENSLAAAVTSADIVRSFDSILAAIESGTSVDRLITSFVMLAASRMARTPTNVEAGWPQLTLELNMASALRSAHRRGGVTAATKGLFHVAWQIFADRWINIEHQGMDQPIQRHPAPAADEDSSVSAILESIQTLDVEGVGGQVVGYLQSGYDGDRLLEEMGRAILRDDTGAEVLPTLRTVFEEWEKSGGDEPALGSGHPARDCLLIGLARYATDVRSNTDGMSAAVTAMRFAEGRTTIDMFE